jgi:hypothetical protein
MTVIAFRIKGFTIKEDVSITSILCDWEDEALNNN